MRIAEYKQIDTERISRTITVYDYNENGEVTGQHGEIITEEKPIMGMVYRDATPEEEADALRQQAEAEEYERNRPQTTEEQLADLAEYVQVFTAMVLGGAE